MALKSPALHVIERIKWMSSWMYSAKANTASYFVSFQKLPEARCSVQVVYLTQGCAVLFSLSPLWRVFLGIFPPDCSTNDRVGHDWATEPSQHCVSLYVLYEFLGSQYKKSMIFSPAPFSRNQFFPLRGTTTSIENVWFRRYSKKNWKNIGLAKKFVWIFL